MNPSPECYGLTPVPDSVTVEGSSLLSVIIILPCCPPATVGVKVTLIVHWPSPGIELPQLFVCAKLLLTVIVPMFMTPSARFCTVMSWGLLVVFTRCFPNFRVNGLTSTPSETPLSRTVCGLAGSLSETQRFPISNPAESGSKVTEMVHDPPARTLLPQLFVCE